MKQERLMKFDYTPKSKTKNIDNDTLISILKTPKMKTFFCFHSYVYWSFGPATKIHRVCKKCHKKQKSNSVLASIHSRWLKETHFI